MTEVNVNQRMNRGKLLLLTGIHFLNDFYSTFLPPLLPLIVAKLQISLTLAGSLAAAFAISSALMQPFFGYVADRMRRKRFVVIGPIIAMVFMSCIGVAPNFAVLTIFLVMGGLGVAAFHPQTVALAGDMAGRRKGLGVSIFISGGTTGYSLGPLAIMYFVTRVGLENSYLSVFPGLVLILMLAKVLGSVSPPSDRVVISPGIRAAFGAKAKPMFILFLLVLFRSVTRFGMVNFLPLLFKERGLSLMAGASALTIFVFCEAMGGMMGGHLSDKFGRKGVVLHTLLLSVPMLYLFLHTSGKISLVFLALSGMMLMSSNSVVIAAAQEMVPKSTGMSSSLVMGFGWGVAGLTMVLIGNLSDHYGVAKAMGFLIYMPMAAAACSFVLPRRAVRSSRSRAV